MSKLALTYYFDIMRLGPQVVNLKLHGSGEEAILHLKNKAKQAFQIPPVFKGDQKLPKKGNYSIGFGFRGLVGRYLDKDEVALIKTYGSDNVWFDHSEKRLCAPDNDQKQQKG